ncbi:MAG: DinB family protein [Candidatus Thorarchaeota archaeon]
MSSINTDHLRHLFEYHFKLNRKFWHFCIENLKWKQMIEATDISVGSIRNLFVHIMSVDERWLSGLRRAPLLDHANPESYGKPEELRLRWDLVEADMRAFLDGLTDSDLEKKFQDNMKVWHVLSHVVNHGTAHRAQIGTILRHFGLTPPHQDYIFFVMGRI